MAKIPTLAVGSRAAAALRGETEAAGGELCLLAKGIQSLPLGVCFLVGVPLWR